MNCRRCRELLSDHLENTLAPPLARDLEAHLTECRACADLFRSFGRVVTTLASLRAPAPPESLVERVLERTRPVLRAACEGAKDSEEGGFGESFAGHVFGWNAVSWVAAAAILATVLLWRPPEFLSVLGRQVSKTAHQTYSYGVRAYYRTERWVEELNVLRMTVGVAFEDRIDRLTERLRDLEEARRRVEGDDTSRSGLKPTKHVASSGLFDARSHL
jgi:hypothetical protein